MKKNRGRKSLDTARSPTARSVKTILDFRTLQFPDSVQCDESNSAQYHTARSHIFCEYLRENEFFSETILGCLSGTQMGWIHKEKNCKKSRDTASLRSGNDHVFS